MKILLVLLLIFSVNALALEAVVTVLETPIFKEKSCDSPVVQYLRKGQVIKVHPSLANSTKYDHLAPSPEKFKELKKKIEQLPEWQDPLFKEGKEQSVYLEDEFIPTVDRLGNTAYVLSNHIYVYFDDPREFSQKVIRKDPTDYRLEEPLPHKYPLYTPSGHRGQVLLGFSRPYNESYNYPDQVKTKSYMTPVELYMSVLWQAPHDFSDRLYVGANWHFKTFENSYSFFDFRESTERYLQLGLGPLLSYDAYKGEKNRLNLSFSINIHPLNEVTIVQKDGEEKDSRLYRGFNFSSRLGAQYHRKAITEDVDFVLGTSFHLESPTKFQAQNAGTQTSWWKKIGGETYQTRGFFTLTGYIGLQASY